MAVGFDARQLFDVTGQRISRRDATNWLALPVALARIGGLFSLPLLFHLFLYFPQPCPGCGAGRS